ncbi:hypothetical protein [Pseudonocardia spirodelae]|uniref:HTH cro/C1-type domain-containing protein n=1 Tax=Pseudonocardia spirodelae TaxID=3133431 RepID=A0ABU8TD02_9PSEU
MSAPDPQPGRGPAEPAGGSGGGLRAARRRRGWSQAEAARALAGLAAGRGGSARAASLKTQLSRWENGHATPDPAHRALLAELYGDSPAALGLEPGPAVDGADRLRAALARAAAVGGPELALLRDQWAATAGLDDRIGAPEAVAAVRGQLRGLAAHATGAAVVAALAGLLAVAALRAGDHARDDGAPDRAWEAYLEAETAGLRAGDATVVAGARARRELLRAALAAADPPPGGPDVHGAPAGLRTTGDDGPAGPRTAGDDTPAGAVRPG